MAQMQIRNLSFTYAGQRQKALDDVSLTVKDGAFFLLCGLSGCGKSTLLRHLKPALAPHGVCNGQIFFNDVPIETLDFRQQSQKIGFVQQNPDEQIVTDKVWHELAFGLESLGCDSSTIRRRVAEMASFFGIQNWFHRSTSELSGGQKQLLNLASVLVMQPEVVILDEPVSQLDPIAASEFLELLARVNREFGTTILLTEHRLEDAIPYATEMAVLDNGRLLCCGSVRDTGRMLREMKHAMYPAMSCAMQVWASLAESSDDDSRCPVTVREGREWLTAYTGMHSLQAIPGDIAPNCGDETVIRVEGIWYRYGKEEPDVVKGLSFTAKRGERISMLGGNGTGKTTTLKLLAGLYRPYRGTLHISGRVMLLPQNPQTLFVKSSVGADLCDAISSGTDFVAEAEHKLMQVAQLCGIAGLLERHPFDLSGGEQQRAALAKLLLLEPDILLLDEPSKGFDAAFQQNFASILDALQQKGITVILVSHDVEFCARYGQRCLLFFDGAVTADEQARTFFTGNHFYTTAACRMARDILPGAVTAQDIIKACGGIDSTVKEQHSEPAKEKNKEQAQNKDTEQNREQYNRYNMQKQGTEPVSPPSDRTDARRTSWNSRFWLCVPLLLIPVTLFLGTRYHSGSSHYMTALLVVLEATVPFIAAFEQRKPQARELVLLAAICAAAVAGRAVFFMLPQCKPVLAIIVLTGAVLGAETGFLAGVITMLVSNLLFGQGVWTVWQMFAMGFCGFLAGVLFRKGRLPRTRYSLCMYGFFSALLIYGVIMNLSTAMLYAPVLTLRTAAAYLLSGFPMDVMHGLATWAFLWFGAEPVMEKIERIKQKYGLYSFFMQPEVTKNNI